MHPVSNYVYKLPMVHVKLINKHEIFETPALIDSGATFSFLQKELAEILKIDLTGEHKTVIGGRGGNFSTVREW